MGGDRDAFLAPIYKNSIEAEEFKNELREKFSDIIDYWDEFLITKVHKFEEYVF